MIKVKHVVVLAVIFGMFPFCGKNPVGPAPDPDWVALTARIDGYRQIYLVDYNHPTNYKQITDNDHQNVEPTFSPDRSRLIYLDKTTGFVHGPQLVLYDVASDSATPLELPHENDPIPVGGKRPIVFSPDKAGLYFRVGGSFSGDEIIYYDFTGQTIANLTQTRDPSEYVIGCKGPDTLIVFSNDTTATGQPWGFYFMNLKGEYLRRLDNPHLEFIWENGITRKGPRNLEWNDALRLFVFAESDTTYPGLKIAIMNLDGLSYHVYTSGTYWDDNPSWGPGGKVIFFDRRSLTDYSGPYTVMYVDLQTGAVEELVKPGVIDGATELSFPDY